MSSSGASQVSVKGHRPIQLAGRARLAPFSDAVQAGQTFYLSGRLGLDPETGTIPASVDDEIRFLLDDMRQVLASAGLSMNDLVQVQIFCPDLTLYDQFNQIYRGYFGDYFPARAFLGSGPLLRGARFEICAIAVKAG